MLTPYMHICMCIYINIYKIIYIYIYLSLCLPVLTVFTVFTCTLTFAYTYVYTYVYTCIYILIHIHVYVYIVQISSLQLQDLDEYIRKCHLQSCMSLVWTRQGCQHLRWCLIHPRSWQLQICSGWKTSADSPVFPDLFCQLPISVVKCFLLTTWSE